MRLVTAYELRVDSLDPEYFKVFSLRGREALSDAWSFRLGVRARAGAIEEIERIALGRRAVLTLDVGDKPRALYGVVAAVALSAPLQSGHLEYELTLVPRLWLLKRKRRSRIFQDMRVTDVVSQVLLEAGISARWQLASFYPARPYCTQYEETDYEFVTRVLAEAGIYFYFAYGGPTDDGFPLMSTAALATAAVGAVPGGGALAGAANAALDQLLVPGDTVMCADDASFYPALGEQDTLASLATALEARAREATRASVAVAATIAATGGPSAQDAAQLQYVDVLEGATSSTRRVADFEIRSTVRATGALVRDYDPERPLTPLTSSALSVDPFPDDVLPALSMLAAQYAPKVDTGAGEDAVAIGAQIARTAAGAAAEISGQAIPPYLEVYDHHSSFLFPEWTQKDDEAKRLLRHERRRTMVARARSSCPEISPGHRFSLVETTSCPFRTPQGASRSSCARSGISTKSFATTTRCT